MHSQLSFGIGDVIMFAFFTENPCTVVLVNWHKIYPYEKVSKFNLHPLHNQRITDKSETEANSEQGDCSTDKHFPNH